MDKITIENGLLAIKEQFENENKYSAVEFIERVEKEIDRLKAEIKTWRERSEWQDGVFENIRSELHDSNLELQCQVTNLETELQQYKNKLADGRMVELPCKIGDKIYFKTYFSNKITDAEIIEIDFARNYIQIKANDCTQTTRRFNYADLNKKFYLTLSEAEQALKDMEGK